MTNEMFSNIMPTNDSWIRERTGIRQRYFAEKEESTSDLAIKTCIPIIERCGASTIDAVILATYTPDHLMPSTASIVQKALGLNEIPVFDVACACAGFTYASILAYHMIALGSSDRILVIGAEVVSRFLDLKDRTTAVLFGDGAGAVLYEAGDKGGILGFDWGCENRSAPDVLTIPAGGSREPASINSVSFERHFIKMQGVNVFRFGVSILPRTINETLKMAELNLDDIDLIIPHQANIRIIEAAAKSLDLPLERFYVNLDRVGNTSAASIPIALSELNIDGKMVSGMKIMMVGFGAGLTWASMLIEI